MIVLLQIPHFRLVGSHNSRVQLDLCYASRMLDDAGIEHVVLNADYGFGGSQYVPWKDLFGRSEWLDRAAAGEHPVLDETVEAVLAYKPETVVVSAGDTVIPTKDFGSPYVAAVLSQKLRAHGVKTVGLGPWYVKNPPVFAEWFDRIFPSAVNRALVDFLTDEYAEVLTGQPVNVLPCFDHVIPRGSTTDYVMTAFGCSYNCAFCAWPSVSNRQVTFQPIDLVLEDLADRRRAWGDKLYLCDAIFPLNARRLRLLAGELEHEKLVLACEARVNSLKPELLEPMHRMGVRTVKVGLEAMHDQTLARMGKGQKVDEYKAALACAREYEMRVVGYLMFGDFYAHEHEMWETIRLAADLDLDYYVVNVAAYHDLKWENKADAHFSLLSARRQNVPDEVVWVALDLQERRENPTTAKVVT